MQAALFVGHGSPLHALNDTAFSRSLKNLGEELPRPNSILVISAHWQTQVPEIVVSAKPKTIHDFYGFPESLYAFQYPASNSSKLIERVLALAPEVKPNTDWGLDHGAWSVLCHLFPKADIPVTQLSLPRKWTAQQHFDLAKKIRPLREEGVLILSSGNIVHNLRALDWNDNAAPWPWAQNFDQAIKQDLLKKNFQNILDYQTSYSSDLWKMSVPTTEHFEPLFYTLGVAGSEDKISFPLELIEMGSISMRSVLVSR